jgi:hypothetical protein
VVDPDAERDVVGDECVNDDVVSDDFSCALGDTAGDALDRAR